MKILIDADDLSKLKPETRDELLALFFGPASPSRGAAQPGLPPATYSRQYDFTAVVDLTPEQVALFMEGAAEQTRRGLRVVAEEGPDFPACALAAAGITNYGHFQGRVTQRTRTVTRRRRAYLFTWDDWTSGENARNGYGYYAVSETTWRSLRAHFNLDQA